LEYKTQGCVRHPPCVWIRVCRAGRGGENNITPQLPLLETPDTIPPPQIQRHCAGHSRHARRRPRQRWFRRLWCLQQWGCRWEWGWAPAARGSVRCATDPRRRSRPVHAYVTRMYMVIHTTHLAETQLPRHNWHRGGEGVRACWARAGGTPRMAVRSACTDTHPCELHTVRI
jgi:hypothetical protein